MDGARRPSLLPSFLPLLFLPAGGEAAAAAGSRRLTGDPPPAPMERLARRRILFAHHAVGDNLLAGLRELLATHPEIRLRLERTGDGTGYLLDVRVGGKGHPLASVDDLSHLLSGTLGEEIDVALCKLGHADFTAGTDAEAIFAGYRQKMQRLAAAYPRIRFHHVTVPLTVRRSGWRTLARRALGRAVDGVEDNLARSRFNELLRRTYAPQVFDLAAVESTWPDGRREIVAHGGETGYALVPAYTDDGDHLNALGRRLAAERFLAFLAALP